jgi:hypothetical protein
MQNSCAIRAYDVFYYKYGVRRQVPILIVATVADIHLRAVYRMVFLAKAVICTLTYIDNVLSCESLLGACKN